MDWTKAGSATRRYRRNSDIEARMGRLAPINVWSGARGIGKAVFDHHEESVAIDPVAKETLASNLDRDTFLPLHPGAARYYREGGITIPTAIVAAD